MKDVRWKLIKNNDENEGGIIYKDLPKNDSKDGTELIGVTETFRIGAGSGD